MPEVTFESEAHDVLAQYQGELRRYLNGVVGGTQTASELKRALGIGYSLSWKIMRAAEASTPMEAGPFLPPEASVKQLVRAAKRRGVTDGLNRLEHAASHFQKFVADRAGDRTSFDVIAAGLTGADAERLGVELRRAAFRANSAIYGQSLSTSIKSVCYRLSGDGSRISAASLDVRNGFCRLLKQSSTSIGASYSKNFAAGSEEAGRARPIDQPAYQEHGVPILSRFSSPHLAFEEHMDSRGVTTRHLANRDLGLGEDISCVYAFVRDDIPTKDVPDTFLDNFACSRVPTRVVYHDVLMHEDLFRSARPLNASTSGFGEFKWPEPGDPTLMPTQEEVVNMGYAPHALHTREEPRYREMVEHVFESLGWDDLDKHRLFRCHIEYPVIGSFHWMRFDIAEWLNSRP